MKKTIDLKCAFLAAVLFLTFSCSKDGKNEDVDAKANSTFAQRPGDDFEIGIEENGVYKITADKSALKNAFQEKLSQQNVETTITSFELIKSVVEGTHDELAYMLYAYNADSSIKMAIFVTYNNNRFAVASLADALDSADGSLTCESVGCGTACAPTATKNLSTGKNVLSCSPCTNSCKKIATVNF